MDWIYNIQRYASLTSSECRAIALISTVIIAGSMGDLILNKSNNINSEATIQSERLSYVNKFELRPAPKDTVRADSIRQNIPTEDIPREKLETGPKLLNINTAMPSELIKLNGIGPSLAKRIVEFRELNGPFKSIEKITGVKGIGAGKLAKIRNHITIRDSS